MKFSREELAFVRESLRKGVRVNLRGCEEGRETKVHTLENPQGDGSLLITRGHTKAIVSVQFKESGSGLLELKLIKNREDFKDSSLEIERIPLSIRKQVESWLEGLKMGLRVELEIVNDDGNVYEAFIFGLRELLKQIDVPDIKDLEKTIRTGILLPQIKVVSFFEGVPVYDPLLVEEEACDCSIVSIEEGGRVRNMWTNKCGEIEIEQVEKMLKDNK